MSSESPVDLPEDLPACKDFRADQEMKLGKDAWEDAEFHEYLLSNNQPNQESFLKSVAKAFNRTAWENPQL